jgi:hypothetical protein
VSAYSSRLSLRQPTNPWVWLVGAIVAVDAVALVRRTPTLTALHREAVKHPVKRVLIAAAWTVLMSHLFLGRP